MKRIFDVIASFTGLIILSPVFLIIFLAILITMGWPIFYRQARVGRAGENFKIIKFRSMVKDAERRGAWLTADGDSRITPVGRFLRRSKLDELPQLINIFLGEMSFVGPRPEVPQYVKLYNNEQMRVLSVRPGLTDPASIAYRDEEIVLARFDDAEKAYIEEIMPAKLKLNLAYMQKATFLTDIGLIFETIVRIFRRS